MDKRLIPSGDSDFRDSAYRLALTLAHDPAGYGISQADSDALSAAVAEFRVALEAARNGATRSKFVTDEKNRVRERLEKLVRRIRDLICLNESLPPAIKEILNVKEDRTRNGSRSCPQEPPSLRFVRALHEGSAAVPMHELRFGGKDSKSKPAGAVRIELFVDLIPPDAPIPQHPGENLNSRPWYLRSYTRSPIKLAPPMARVPMMVVYWGRWADSTGEVGPWSATVVSRVEGWTQHALAHPTFAAKKIAPLLEDDQSKRESTYSVAVIEVQMQSMNPQMIEPNAGPREVKKLEDQSEREAA